MIVFDKKECQDTNKILFLYHLIVAWRLFAMFGRRADRQTASVVAAAKRAVAERRERPRSDIPTGIRWMFPSPVYGPPRRCPTHSRLISFLYSFAERPQCWWKGSRQACRQELGTLIHTVASRTHTHFSGAPVTKVSVFSRQSKSAESLGKMGKGMHIYRNSFLFN